jgi:hypothetical protein
MASTARVVCLMAALIVSVQAWENGKKGQPAFGTHDYIAYKAFTLTGQSELPWLRDNLNWYFLGTEAPDKGTTATTEPGYRDLGQCHCVLFDRNGNVTKDHAELRVRQEFDRARRALAAGDRRMAAFYSGAMAHYLGDLSAFYHMMGKQSHWGEERKGVHGKYEAAVERTIAPATRTSVLLDGYIQPLPIPALTPETIARAVATFTENGTSHRDPRWMDTQYQSLIRQKLNSKPERWGQDFRDQTGQNVNYSVNAIAKLLLTINR